MFVITVGGITANPNLFVSTLKLSEKDLCDYSTLFGPYFFPLSFGPVIFILCVSSDLC